MIGPNWAIFTPLEILNVIFRYPLGIWIEIN